jgi:ribosomal protein L11
VIARSKRTVIALQNLTFAVVNYFFCLVKHNGNITFDEVIAIARIMRTRSQSRYLIGTVKEILGTCMVI